MSKRLGPRLGGRNLVFCPFLVEISVVPPLTSASVRLRVRRWLWYSDDDAAAVLHQVAWQWLFAHDRERGHKSTRRSARLAHPGGTQGLGAHHAVGEHVLLLRRVHTYLCQPP